MSPACPLHRTDLRVVVHPAGDYALAPRCGRPVTGTERCALQAGHPGKCD